jgi:hypothetical protein
VLILAVNLVLSSAAILDMDVSATSTTAAAATTSSQAELRIHPADLFLLVGIIPFSL